jgi:hypothetical protein
MLLRADFLTFHPLLLATATENVANGASQNAHVQPQGLMTDVGDVKPHARVKVQRLTARNLP